MHKTSQKGKSKHRGSIYAQFMFIHYPSYTYRIPIVNPGLIFGGAYIQKDFYVSLQGGLYLGFYGMLQEIKWWCEVEGK